MLRMTRKKAAVVGGVTAVVVTGGVAFAYWTSTGEGTGTATTGTSSAWEVSVDNSTPETQEKPQPVLINRLVHCRPDVPYRRSREIVLRRDQRIQRHTKCRESLPWIVEPRPVEVLKRAQL